MEFLADCCDAQLKTMHFLVRPEQKSLQRHTQCLDNVGFGRSEVVCMCVQLLQHEFVRQVWPLKPDEKLLGKSMHCCVCKGEINTK